jgi:AhpD family alkylhydroperoxidase
MQSMSDLDRLPLLAKRAPVPAAAFWKYDQAALADGAIPRKYKELMAVAVALTTQCAYCIAIHKKNAVDAGATPEELAETVHVAAVIRAGGAVAHGVLLMDA